MTTKKPSWYFQQSGVLPIFIENNSPKILFITAQKKQEWIFPKGIIEPGMTPEESALNEAWEEAGISGNIISKKIGQYQQKKWGSTCIIQIYAMQVITIHSNWPEKKIRKRIYIHPSDFHQIPIKKEIIQFWNENDKEIKKILSKITI